MPPPTIHPLTVPHFIPPPQTPVSMWMSPCSTPPTSELPGATSLWRFRCIMSEWTQTRQVLCYVCVGGLISAGICSLFGGPVFERFQGSRLIETSGPPTGLPFSSVSFSLSLIQQQGSAASVHWLGTTICIWLFQLLVGSFGGQSC